MGVGKASEESISLHDTHKRLSRNLGNKAIREQIGAKVDSSKITLFAQTLLSQEAEDFVRENDEILTVVGRLLEATAKRGIFVLDRGGDRRLL